MSHPIRYIIAIRPPANIIAGVKGMKLALKKAIGGFYNSVNSEAHITLGKCAYLLFKDFNAKFWCDSFAIRKFSDDRKQFDVIAELPMLGANF